MASSSGLYNGNDSDGESFADELSPRDGYFDHRPVHPRDVLVPDPSQRDTQAEKEREAREQETHRASQAYVHHSPQASAQRSPHLSQPGLLASPTRRRPDLSYDEEAATESTPFIPTPPPPPPPYADATAGRPYLGQTRGAVSYLTMGNPQIFPARHEPEDFGGQSLLGNNDPTDDRWQRNARHLWKLFQTKSGDVLKALVVLTALAFGIGFIVVAVHKVPDNPARSLIPDYVLLACPSAIKTASARFEVQKPSDFSFLELLHRPGEDGDHLQQVHTSGEIHVQTTTEHLETRILVEVMFYYSDERILNELWFEHDHSDVLEMYTPSHLPGSSRYNHAPCLYIVVNIRLSPGQVLNSVTIQTQSMSINFHEGINLSIADRIKLLAMAGYVRFPSSRSLFSIGMPHTIEVETGSGPIHGAFTLNDMLDIKSRSGTIDIEVLPKEASQKHPEPASLKIQTLSGAVRVSTPLLNDASPEIPVRDYRTHISSGSGSVHAKLLHGSSTVITTDSGSVNAIFVPCGLPNQSSYIGSTTDSGSLNLDVWASVFRPEQSLYQINCRFNTTTGNMRVTYPPNFGGILEGWFLSGSFSYDWPGLKIDKDGREDIGRFLWHHILAHSGSGTSRSDFHSVTGSIKIIGHEAEPEEASNEHVGQLGRGHNPVEGNPVEASLTRAWKPLSYNVVP